MSTKIISTKIMSRNKIVAAIIMAMAVSFFMTGCSGAKETGAAAKNVVEINEKMFIAQVNDVYLNADEYLGKTIKLEGIFKREQYFDAEDPYFFVIRYGPGCCGYDGNVGFEIKWDKHNMQPYPADESWVEATGELKFYEENGYSKYLYLDLSSLAVLNRRGAEVVLQ